MDSTRLDGPDMDDATYKAPSSLQSKTRDDSGNLGMFGMVQGYNYNVKILMDRCFKLSYAYGAAVAITCKCN